MVLDDFEKLAGGTSDDPQSQSSAMGGAPAVATCLLDSIDEVACGMNGIGEQPLSTITPRHRHKRTVLLTLYFLSPFRYFVDEPISSSAS